MPHISDGDLHAWLDGAIPEDSKARRALRQHLELCPDCRTRLEEARVVRARAGEILAGVEVPAGRMPDFAEIERRAETGELPAASSRPRRTGSGWPGWRSAERLAWAATVVLALGAGWMGRELLLQRGWSDPFHPVGAERSVIGERAERQSGESEAGEPGKPSAEEMSSDAYPGQEVAGERNREPEQRADARASRPSPDAAAAKSVGEARAEKPGADARGRRDRMSGVESEVQGRPERLKGELSEVDEAVGGNEGELDRLEAMEDRALNRPESEAFQRSRPPGQGVPEDREAGNYQALTGCYGLEASWAGGLVSLPSTVILGTGPAEADGKTVLEARFGEALPGPEKSAWTPFGSDSIWMRLVLPPDIGATLTLRLRRGETVWAGSGWIWDPDSRLPSGESAGPVRLIRTECTRPDA